MSGRHTTPKAGPGVPSTPSHNLLVVAHNYPPHVGGLEVVAQSEARGMARSGWAVKVLTSVCTDAPSSGSQMEQGTEVTRIAAWHGLERLGVPFPLFSPTFLTSVWRAVKKADLVHIHYRLWLHMPDSLARVNPPFDPSSDRYAWLAERLPLEPTMEEVE